MKPGTGNNPAQLSSRIGELFPHGVVVATLAGPCHSDALIREERREFNRGVHGHAAEFTAGRLCGRRALLEFGIVDFPLGVGADRRPLWPASMLGSISHCNGFTAAAVALRSDYRALGLGIEIIGEGNDDELWPQICTPAEEQWLRSLGETEQAQVAALILSAKKAFCKCQFELTGQTFEYRKVSLDLIGWELRAGVFAARPLSPPAMEQSPKWTGRFQFLHGRVLCGVAVPVQAEDHL